MTTTTLAASTAYEQLIAHARRVALLQSTASLLSWDQETMMPPKGLAHRTDQLSQLARMAHEMATAPAAGEWLDACEQAGDLAAQPTSDSAVNLRELRRDYDRATKLPVELVEAFARVTSMAKAAWVEARQRDDFQRFAPHLAEVIKLCREKAACYGWDEDGGEPWDALAESFEPGLNARSVAAVFDPLRPRLVELVDQLLGSPTPPRDVVNGVKLPAEAQRSFVEDVARSIGFDFARGRLDTSAHPFCSGTCCNDVRLTTRFHEDMVVDALGSTLHEAGHGIYNQGLPEAHTGTPRGKPVGLSIHESQSRLWENHVGRSRAFWQWCTPKLREHFGQAVAGVGQDEAYASANIVQRSLIRVEADEATYNLHIMIRFTLERAMLRGDLAAGDLPGAWNERYRQDLGVEVPSDRVGCLQDIHWSMGALGYFPTYTLGNLFAAQFFEAAERAMPDLHAQIAAGQFTPLRTWLNEQIHAPGMTYPSDALCLRVTGQPLSHEPLLRHLSAKLKPLYGLPS